ncbi:hypothetical protein MSPP1_003541 [Malassezia sp. CBS 17886]|nr:hypothetical protein MSPP1_003541 [Malassezia sp. CBS 17886]
MDPHFRRVVSYFRPSDYSAWAGTAAAFPGALWLLEKADPTRPRRGMGTALRFAALLGAAGGFLLAYQRSSFRFWGWTENKREAEIAHAAADKGSVPGEGKSALSEEMQGAAFRNSLFSQLNFAVFPWFNVVNHKFHGSAESGAPADE